LQDVYLTGLQKCPGDLGRAVDHRSGQRGRHWPTTTTVAGSRGGRGCGLRGDRGTRGWCLVRG
jgi:hypothetical protein